MGVKIETMESVFQPRPEGKPTLESRVVAAAESALAEQQHVNAIDVLTGMRLLAPDHVDAWRKGRIPILEEAIQASPGKVANSLEIFRRWAESRGLQPMETRFVRATRTGVEELQVIGTKYAGLESAFRVRYVSPTLSSTKLEKLRERSDKPPERVVFLNRRDSACSECGADLPSGGLLSLEADQALCLACAGMAHLEFLPRGDTALTRRAAKYSELHAVVVEFSRSRGRYERQGILVTEAALHQAEQECVADAPDRARQRVKAAAAREKEDAIAVEQMIAKIQALFPGCPPSEARHIASHTAVRGSGRVGRSAAGRKLDSEALTLAVQAAVRHRHTNYDQLLSQGVDRASARAAVRDQIDQILDAWRWGI